MESVILEPPSPALLMSALARRSDPATSHEAAASVQLADVRRAVLKIVQDAGWNGVTQEEATGIYRGQAGRLCSSSTVTGRFSELADAGLIRRTTRRRQTSSGRSAFVYTDADPEGRR